MTVAHLMIARRRTNPRNGSALENAVLVDTETLQRPREKQPKRFQATLTTHSGTALETAIRFPKSLWLKIGRPENVEVVGLMPSGINIRSGLSHTVARVDEDSVFIHVPNSAIGIAAGKRKKTHVDCFVEDADSSICIASPDLAWLKDVHPAETLFAKKEKPADAEKAEPRRVLESTNPTPSLPPVTEKTEGEVRLSTVRNAAGASIRFSIPKTLLDPLAQPARCMLSGTMHEGLVLTPVPFAHDGVKITYETSAELAYVACGLGGKGLPDKEARRSVAVHAEVKDGVLRISGPPHSWVARSREWRPHREIVKEAEAARPQAQLPTSEEILSRLNQTAAAPAAPQVLAPPPPRPEPTLNTAGTPPKPIEALMVIAPGTSQKEMVAMITTRLKECKAILGVMNDQTGIQFVIRSDMTLGVKS